MARVMGYLVYGTNLLGSLALDLVFYDFYHVRCYGFITILGLVQLILLFVQRPLMCSIGWIVLSQRESMQ